MHATQTFPAIQPRPKGLGTETKGPGDEVTFDSVARYDVGLVRDVGSISNLEGHGTSRALFLKKKGAISKDKRALLCLLQNLGGARAPSAPGSYVYGVGSCLTDLTS